MDLDLLLTIVVIVVCLLFVWRKFSSGKAACTSCGGKCGGQGDKAPANDCCPGKSRE